MRLLKSQSIAAGVAFILLSPIGPACAGESAELEQVWKPTTLSKETQSQIHQGLSRYQECLNEETRQHLADRDDSRRVTDLILRNCESRLLAIKPAFDAAEVPSSISDRYLRSKRSRAAQKIVQVVMGTHAVRAAGEEAPSGRKAD